MGVLLGSQSCISYPHSVTSDLKQRHLTTSRAGLSGSGTPPRLRLGHWLRLWSPQGRGLGWRVLKSARSHGVRRRPQVLPGPRGRPQPMATGPRGRVIREARRGQLHELLSGRVPHVLCVRKAPREEPVRAESEPLVKWRDVENPTRVHQNHSQRDAWRDPVCSGHSWCSLGVRGLQRVNVPKYSVWQHRQDGGLESRLSTRGLPQRLALFPPGKLSGRCGSWGGTGQHRPRFFSLCRRPSASSHPRLCPGTAATAPHAGG